MSLLSGHYTGLQDYDPPTLEQLKARIDFDRDRLAIPPYVLTMDGHRIAMPKHEPRKNGPAPGRKRCVWEYKPEEDAAIIEGRANGVTYKAISEGLPNRTPVSVRMRARSLGLWGKV